MEASTLRLGESPEAVVRSEVQLGVHTERPIGAPANCGVQGEGRPVAGKPPSESASCQVDFVEVVAQANPILAERVASGTLATADA